eukprot:1926043-Pyramimonas_sp.AAC.1
MDRWSDNMPLFDARRRGAGGGDQKGVACSRGLAFCRTRCFGEAPAPFREGASGGAGAGWT